MQLVWLQSILRIGDNPALYHALHSRQQVLIVYARTPSTWRELGFGRRKINAMAKALADFAQTANKYNLPLLIANAQSLAQEQQLVKQLLLATKASALHYNYQWQKSATANAQQLVTACAKLGIATFAYEAECIIEPRQIRNQKGRAYRVFTPFMRRWQEQAQQLSRQLHPGIKPCNYSWSAKKISALNKALSPCFELSFVDAKTSPTIDLAAFNHGLSAFLDDKLLLTEQAAHSTLEEFIHQKLPDYQQNKEFLHQNALSGLGLYVANGKLSTLQCYRALGQMTDINHSAAQSWLRQLIWRDFFRHLLHAYPKIGIGQPFLDFASNIKYYNDRQQFRRWCRGQTGVPIIDAAMRQLWRHGRLHNRLRMLAASYLCKHLLIDWRWGEAWFMRHLLDADFATNNGNWQWCASVGADSVPYFRFFNPVLQSKKYDATGDYIRRHLPRLASLNNKDIHQPPLALRAQLNYPPPLISQQAAKERAMAAFVAAKNKSN